MDITYIKKFVYQKGYKYTRYNMDNAEVVVSPGDRIKDNTILARGTVSKMAYRINVSDFVSKPEKYLHIVHGQIINKGDIMLKKRKKVLVSPVEGIVDLSELQKGHILIKSYPEDITLKSDIDGKISSIEDEGRKIIIDTEVVRCNLKYVFGKTIEARLKYIADSKGVLNLENINSSCIDSIVYVGNIITQEIIKKSLAVGVVGIIGCGIEVKEHQSLEELIDSIPLTIAIIDGFGKIEDLYFSKLKNFEKKQILIETETNSIVIPDRVSAEDVKSAYIRKVNINDIVQIFAFPYWGYSGKVINVNTDVSNINVLLDSNIEVSVQSDDVIGII
ncbi:MAG: hypothetical protein ACYDBX_00935 [Patescibacteria group bacterium]